MSREESAEASWMAQVRRIPVLPHEELMGRFRELEDAYSRHPLPVPPEGKRPVGEEARSNPEVRAAWDAWDAACVPVWTERRRDPAARRITGEIAGANLRLVLSLARKRARHSLRLMDLVSAGNEGLLTAIERFSWRRGFRFSTYATWWIKQAIGRWITDHRRTIRMPAHASKVQRDIIEAAEAIEAAGGAVPDRDGLAALTGASRTVARATLHTGRGMLPLDARMRGAAGEEGRTLADSVPDPGADPFRDVSELELLEVIAQVVENLSEKEEAILRLRFGLTVDPTDDAACPITDDELAAIANEGRGLGSADVVEPTDEDMAGVDDVLDEEGSAA